MLKEIDISKMSPVGKKHCQSKCDRRTVRTESSVKIICLGCNRIVMDIKN